MIHGVLSPFLTLAVVLLSVGLLLCAGIIFLLARSLVCPPRMSDGKAMWVLKRLSPGDLGLPFEDVSFDIRDEASGEPLRIAGWWIPHPDARGRTVLILHGYADAKVGSIAWAPTWHALGWNILAIDLRAHGESSGRFCTGGYFERHDVGQVINLLRARRPDETRRLVLFGISFGAAVAVAAAVQRTDIDAIVLDSPVPDFAQAAMIQMNGLGAPSGLLRRLAVKLAQQITGAQYADVRMLDLISSLRCPAFISAPDHDVLLDNGVGDRLRESLPANSVYWLVRDTGHLLALPTDPNEYQRRIGEFLDANLSSVGEMPRISG